MKSYVDGSSVTLIFSPKDDAGAPLQATSALYSVFDAIDTVLIAETPAPGYVSGNASVSITIPGVNNSLAQGAASDVRRVSLKTTLADGKVFVFEQTYVVVAASQLSSTNSFQTFQEAELTAFNLGGLDVYEASERQAKINALARAYMRIAGMSLSVNGSVVKASELPNYLATAPADLVARLKMAQVIEANHILSGDRGPGGDENLLSETVGESTKMWKQSKPLVLPLCKDAMRVLSGYWRHGAVIGRG